MIINLDYGIKDILSDCIGTSSAYGLGNVFISKSKNIWEDDIDEYSLHMTNGKLILSIPIELDLSNQYELDFLGNTILESNGRLMNGNIIFDSIKNVNNGFMEIIFKEKNIDVKVKSKRKEIVNTIDYYDIEPKYSRYPDLCIAIQQAKRNQKVNSPINAIAINPYLMGLISNSMGNPTGLKMEFSGDSSAVFIRPNETKSDGRTYDNRLKALLMPLAMNT